MTPVVLYLSASDPDAILVTARVLREGGIAVIPTDTVYGLAASIFQPQAIERVFTVKGRNPDAQVPVLIASASDLPILVSEIPRAAWPLINQFWPGALTLVFPAKAALSPLVAKRGGTVAVRVPAARSTLRLLEVLGEPLIGTSANPSGQPPATTAESAAAELGDRVDIVLADDGAITEGRPSTVVELTGGASIVHRVGAIFPGDIRTSVGPQPLVQDRLTDSSDGQ